MMVEQVSEQPDNTDARLPLQSPHRGAGQEELEIGQAPHHPLQLSGLGGHRLEICFT